MVKTTTKRASKIKRALENALADPSITTVVELARFIDWYLTASSEADKH
jgi:hypothetical protein